MVEAQALAARLLQEFALLHHQPAKSAILSSAHLWVCVYGFVCVLRAVTHTHTHTHTHTRFTRAREATVSVPLR